MWILAQFIGSIVFRVESKILGPGNKILPLSIDSEGLKHPGGFGPFLRYGIGYGQVLQTHE